MFNLIPSPEVREYLKSINYQLSDFQKATLLWNSQYGSQAEKMQKLSEMILATNDIDLKLQMAKRYRFEQEVVDVFKSKTDNGIFVVYDEY